MSKGNVWDDDDITGDGQDGDNSPAELRKAYNKLKSELKQVQAERDQLAAITRDSSVTTVLKDKGVNPAYAKFIPSDVSTKEQVEAWIADNAELLAVPSAPSTENTPQAAVPVVDPNLAALTRIAETQSSGQQINDGDYQQMLSRIAATNTPEELNMLLHGNPYGPSFGNMTTSTVG